MNIRMYFIFLENRSISLHFAANNISLSSTNFLWRAPEFLFIPASDAFRPFKVTVVTQGHWYWCQSKAHCDFLLVHNSNLIYWHQIALGPILHRFGDLTAFMCSWPHPYSTLILGVFPLTRSPTLGVNERTALSYLDVKFFSKNSNLCDHDTWTSRTDRQTDGQTTCNLITALCVASRGKNCSLYTS